MLLLLQEHCFSGLNSIEFLDHRAFGRLRTHESSIIFIILLVLDPLGEVGRFVSAFVTSLVLLFVDVEEVLASKLGGVGLRLLLLRLINIVNLIRFRAVVCLDKASFRNTFCALTGQLNAILFILPACIFLVFSSPTWQTVPRCLCYCFFLQFRYFELL